ncbi:MAG: AraC family transcriptional regulator [Burkholderiaceae bacterium]
MPAAPATAARATVRHPAPGVLATWLDSAQTFPRHAHDTYGIGRIRRGAQRSWSAAGWVEAGPGDLVMVNPGEVHDGLPLDEHGRCWHMLYLEPALVEAVAAEVLPGSGPAPLWRPVARDDALAAAFERGHAWLAAPHPHAADALARDEAGYALLAVVLARQAGVALPRGATPAIARARQRLDDDPADDPGLAGLAAESGLSRFQLLRGFARELGLTPHAYLVQRRLALARALIDGGAAIADAAAQSGFADQSHLTRLFRRHWGYTPAQYAPPRSPALPAPRAGAREQAGQAGSAGSPPPVPADGRQRRR